MSDAPSDWTASESERQRRDVVLARIRDSIRAERTIPFQPFRAGSEPEFGGHAGRFRYLFEGEDDLLHLIIEKIDGSGMKPSESRAAARFLLPEVPEAMIWLRPGEAAHHYYLGHDLLCSTE